MDKISAFLKQYPNGVFCTEANGQPKARVFQYLWSEAGKVYFCTANTKAVYKQLSQNVRCAFCTFKPDYSQTLTLEGNAVFVRDAAAKQRALDENPGIKAIYKDASNPAFELFYMDVSGGEWFSFEHGPEPL